MKTTIPLPFTPDLPQLRLETNGSIVTVVGISDGEAPFLEAKGEPVDVTNVDGVVRLSTGFWGDKKLTLHVPKNLRATISCDMGKTFIEDLAGCDLTLSSNAGTLQLRNARGRFTMSANAGEIRAENVGGTFDVTATTGSVKMSVVALDVGTHHIRSTMGSVKVELSPGIDVRIDSRTVMGSTRTRYPNNPDSQTKLLLEAELGSVKVSEGVSAADPRHGDWPDWRRWWAAAATAFERTLNAPAFDVASPQASSPKESSSPEILKILGMVEQGIVSIEQADKLIRAVGEAKRTSHVGSLSSEAVPPFLEKRSS